MLKYLRIYNQSSRGTLLPKSMKCRIIELHHRYKCSLLKGTLNVTRWNYYHLFSPFARLILLWTIHPCIISSLLLKLFNHIIHFNYVLGRIPCIGQWCFCCISCNTSLNGLGDSNICFVKIYLWPFHLFTKSSLCVGDLVTHHTPHLRVTHIRWPVPYKGWCPLASLSEARWMVERGWLCSIF